MKIERIILGTIIVAFIVFATVAIMAASPAAAQDRNGEYHGSDVTGMPATKGKRLRKSRVAPSTFISGDLVERARSYMHTNPTGWRRNSAALITGD